MSDDVGADEPVPKLPRGRGLKFSGPEMFRILMTLITLIGVVVLAKPCANSVSNFVMGYPQGSGADKNAPPKPGTVQPPPAPSNVDQYEQLRPGMSDEEIKAAIERSKAKAAQQGQGSAVAPPTNTPPPPKANTAPTPPSVAPTTNSPPTHAPDEPQ